jgi:hypothetical protein
LVCSRTTPGDVRTRLFGRDDPRTDGWREPDVRFPVRYKVATLPHPTAAENVEVGVIRIESFLGEEDDSIVEQLAFVDEFVKLAELMAKVAPLALIVDVRGNSGGTIQFAERILQLLTPDLIRPASFQFLNNPLVRHVVKQNPDKDLTGFGLDEDTGAIYSQADEITTAEEANDLGQRY